MMPSPKSLPIRSTCTPEWNTEEFGANTENIIMGYADIQASGYRLVHAFMQSNPSAQKRTINVTLGKSAVYAIHLMHMCSTTLLALPPIQALHAAPVLNYVLEKYFRGVLAKWTVLATCLSSAPCDKLYLTRLQHRPDLSNLSLEIVKDHLLNTYITIAKMMQLEADVYMYSGKKPSFIVNGQKDNIGDVHALEAIAGALELLGLSVSLENALKVEWPALSGEVSSMSALLERPSQLLYF